MFIRRILASMMLVSTIGCAGTGPAGPSALPSAQTSQATTEQQGNTATGSTTTALNGGDVRSVVPVATIAAWTLRVVAVADFTKSCGSYLWKDIKLLKIPSSSTWNDCYEWGTLAAASAVVSYGAVKAVPKVKVTSLRNSLYKELKPVFGKAVTWNRLKTQVNKKTLADLTSVIGDIIGMVSTDVDRGIQKACSANGVPVK